MISYSSSPSLIDYLIDRLVEPEIMPNSFELDALKLLFLHCIFEFMINTAGFDMAKLTCVALWCSGQGVAEEPDSKPGDAVCRFFSLFFSSVSVFLF